jgi:hypothetical protein
MCCIFQTEKLHFNNSFLHEGVSFEIKELKVKKSELESQLKEICGNGDKDPASPIHQARLTHAKTKKILENNFYMFAMGFPFFAEQTVNSLQTTEERLAKMVASNKSLIPLAHFIRYDELKLRKTQTVDQLKSTQASLESLEVLAQQDPSAIRFLQEKKKISESFQKVLEPHLFTIMKKPEKMTDQETADFFLLFKIWANIVCPNNFVRAVMNFKPAFSGHLMRETKDTQEQALQLKKFDEKQVILRERMFQEMIDAYVKQPLNYVKILGCDTEVRQIHLALEQSKAIELVQETLYRAIYNHHRKSFSTLHSDADEEHLQIPLDMEKIKQGFGEYAFNEMISSYAKQPLDRISIQTCDDIANQIHFHLKIPLETVNKKLSAAIDAQHGQEGLKKINTNLQGPHRGQKESML